MRHAFAVSQLTPGGAGNEPQSPFRIEARGEAFEEQLALLRGETRRVRHIPPQFDSSGRGVYMLSTGPYLTRGSVIQLGGRDPKLGSDLEEAVGHGRNLAERR